MGACTFLLLSAALCPTAPRFHRDPGARRRATCRPAGFGLVKAKDALLLNIASFISCHKLAGVALARCSWRSVKNDPPTAERAAHVVAEPIGGLGKPRP